MKTYFSKTLRALRTNAALSQQALADIICISKSSINMYERGEREPGFKNLYKIAVYFNVDMNYLLGVSKNNHEFFSTSNPSHQLSDKEKNHRFHM